MGEEHRFDQKISKRRFGVIFCLLLLATIPLGAQVELEALALSSYGSVYVQRPGRRFAETIKLNIRYGPGTVIRTESGSSVELLLSNDTTLQMAESQVWTIGEDDRQFQINENPSSSSESLWDMTIGKLMDVNTFASRSNAVGAIRVTGNESPLENLSIADPERRIMEYQIESLGFSKPAVNARYAALIAEGFRQYEDAVYYYQRAIEATQDLRKKNSLLEMLAELYSSNDRPEHAQATLGRREFQ